MVVFPANWRLIDGLARSWQQFSCLSDLLNNTDADAGTFAHDMQSDLANDDLLARRMRALGFDMTEVVRFWPDVVPDLHKTCVACGSRAQCNAGLRSVSPYGDGLDAQTWQDYCPNIATLKMLGSLLPAMR